MPDPTTSDLLVQMFGGTETRTVRASQTLFREGEPGDAMYVVVEGELEITIRGITLERVGPGGIVGEMALVDASPRTATVSATTDSKVVEVPTRTFEALVQQKPAFARHIVSVVAERLRKMNRYL
jgi:CRP-like cAMP-binding protein